MRRFKNIVFILEDLHADVYALQKALQLARKNRAALRVVEVLAINPLERSLQRFSDKWEAVREEMKADRKREIEESLYGSAQDLEVRVDVLSGKAFVEIIRYVQVHCCDLVIKSVGSERRLQSMLFGSTDLNLLRKCPCPVWIVKPESHPLRRKILAAVDLESLVGREEPDMLHRQIVEISSSLARRESAELYLVSAYVIFDGGRLANKLSKHFEEDSALWVKEQEKNIQGAQAAFSTYFKRHLEQRGMNELRYSFHFVEGEAEDVIVDLAEKEEIDLVVMGTVGRSDLAGFLVGNTSEAVLSRINCSVLAVKPPGFSSPVLARPVEHDKNR